MLNCPECRKEMEKIIEPLIRIWTNNHPDQWDEWQCYKCRIFVISEA